VGTQALRGIEEDADVHHLSEAERAANEVRVCLVLVLVWCGVVLVRLGFVLVWC
jgi:hypothetical protein